MPEFTALLEGYHRFRADAYRQQKARYDALEQGQSPPVMVISCCDSRVDPATIFDTVPGQVFALRNVANLVPPFETGGGLHGASAAIEFGVLGLEVKHIVVVGHGQCGGIKAALEQSNPASGQNIFIDDWMGIVSDARDDVLARAPVDPQRALEMEAVKVSLLNLRTFPFVRTAEEAGNLALHGWWFDMREGVLWQLDQNSDAFIQIV